MDEESQLPSRGERQHKADRDNARIGAEILGNDDGTDPFVAAVRATRMPMIITNPRAPDNPVMFVNDAFCRLTGYSREEILGRNCRFLQGPETDRETVGRIKAAVQAVEPIETDIRNYRKDGTLFWNRLLLAPVSDAAGTLAYFFASQVDVTLERERLAGLETHNAALLAEVSDRLRRQEHGEARLRVATKAGRMGIWELDLRTFELTASRTCRENFGCDPEAPFALVDMEAAIHPDDREAVRAVRRHTLDTGEDYETEFRTVAPSGTIRWIELRAQVELAADNTLLTLAGISLDVTARKQGEERTRVLSEMDGQFRTLEDPADMALSAVTMLGQALGVSRAGYGTIDLVAETVDIERDWSAPGVRSMAGRHHFRDYGSYIDQLKAGEIVLIEDAETDDRTRENAQALKDISARALINIPVTEPGGVIALLFLNNASARKWSPEEVAFIREVASRTRMAVQRRRAEHELRDLAASLESEVEARTAALMETEAALRQSQKMEAVGQLTGGLAHDFNNLLTGVTGSLELLQTRIAQGRINDVDRYVNAAQGAAKRAAALTHRLLAFSRRQTLDPRPTDINRLIRGMEDLVRRTVGPAIAVEPAVAAAGLWSTLVDPGQLENALLNLCINARDAMPDGGTLTIETGNCWMDARMARDRELPAGQYVSMSVSDTGTGMTPEVVAKVFDPFFTTKPIGQGTGLGLSMIYGFAKQSGGQVRIYSEVGQGTMVCIYLPRHLGATEAAESHSEAADLPRAEDGQTVLVVDDEPTVRMLAVEVLEDLGYKAIEAANGAAGLQILQSDIRIDLLVTDVGLPKGMNGRQLADAAREARPRLKVLFITGYAENAALSHGHLAQGMYVLTKPFAIQALASRIKELIDMGES